MQGTHATVKFLWFALTSEGRELSGALMFPLDFTLTVSDGEGRKKELTGPWDIGMELARMEANGNLGDGESIVNLEIVETVDNNKLR